MIYDGRVHLLDDEIHSEGHFLCAFATRASIFPDTPVGPLGFDLGGQETFVLSIVPLPYLLRNDMVWQLLDMIK